MILINNIRSNLLNGDIDSNLKLIPEFRNNIIQILSTMSKMPGVMSQMPPVLIFN
jgi:hypothetical protein